MNNLQELKKKIQEEIPEILDLKKGCIVLLEEPMTWNGGYIEECEITDATNKDFVVFEGNRLIDHAEKTIQRHDIKEILGRPITLEDVLRVMPDGYRIDNRGFILLGDLCQEVMWQLGKTLDQQSPEVISFLYNLIVEK